MRTSRRKAGHSARDMFAFSDTVRAFALLVPINGTLISAPDDLMYQTRYNTMHRFYLLFVAVHLLCVALPLVRIDGGIRRPRVSFNTKLRTLHPSNFFILSLASHEHADFI